MKPKEFSDESFFQEIIENGQLRAVIVIGAQYSADVFRMVNRAMPAIAESYGERVLFGFVYTHDRRGEVVNPLVFQRYPIGTHPLILGFKKGIEVCGRIVSMGNIDQQMADLKMVARRVLMRPR
ncbi:MAG TPA: hypothetical protein VF817_02520 [Patescibacteria group bacterium]